MSITKHCLVAFLMLILNLYQNSDCVYVLPYQRCHFSWSVFFLLLLNCLTGVYVNFLNFCDVISRSVFYSSIFSDSFKLSLLSPQCELIVIFHHLFMLPTYVSSPIHVRYIVKHSLHSILLFVNNNVICIVLFCAKLHRHYSTLNHVILMLQTQNVYTLRLPINSLV